MKSVKISQSFNWAFWLLPALLATSSLHAEDANPKTATLSADQVPPAAEAPGEPAADGSLRLNFRGAPLEMVLNYLSEAA